jgi:glycosyltransferase involved in cell wall biosynthesis
MLHNFYQSSSPSGEDVVFRQEAKMLREYDNDVILFAKRNNSIVTSPNYKKFILPFRLIWSRETYNELRKIIKKEKPKIAHFHNIWYLISPSAYYACKDAGIPVIQTLHNFRFFCANGLLMRDSRICEECLGKWPWRGAKYGCYRGSRLYSFPIALVEAFHKFTGTWKNKIDAFIALTEFSKKKFVECGLPSEKIFVKPNFLQNPPKLAFPNNGFAAFVGRLSVEKGLNILVDAFKNLDSYKAGSLILKIIGDGPLKKQVEQKLEDEKILNIELTGRKTATECMELLQSARFVLMPSVWYEGFPMVILEAFSSGKPVIASRLGALTELVDDGKTGLLFEPGNPEDLASKIKWMLDNEDACIQMGKNARKVFEEKYTAEKNYEMLMKIYQSVLSNH